jgi:hypothetical protein
VGPMAVYVLEMGIEDGIGRRWLTRRPRARRIVGGGVGSDDKWWAVQKFWG